MRWSGLTRFLLLRAAAALIVPASSAQNGSADDLPAAPSEVAHPKRQPPKPAPQKPADPAPP
ncbi:MAG TPA: hypothetical protein VF447_08660, partial [Terriglobales bacterium]